MPGINETAAQLPLLWLCGPPGIGKTTVAWETYQRTSAEVPVGYVDIDQLGICWPEPPDDQGRHRLQARNLNAMLPHFAAAGAHGVIVSGVVDPEQGIGARQIPHADLTVVRLTADPGEVARRYLNRPYRHGPIEEVLREAAMLDDTGFADVTVDSTTLTIEETVERVRRNLPNWRREQCGQVNGPGSVPGQILWLCGPKAVGKSTVGWEAFQAVKRSGAVAAFADLQQLGFLQPTETVEQAKLAARNAAALWPNFRAVGADCLIIVGGAETSEDIWRLRDAMAPATVTAYRLHADSQRLHHRVRWRGRGKGPGIPGDHLVGLAEPELCRIAEQAAAAADALSTNGIGDRVVDTNDRDPEEIAASILDDWRPKRDRSEQAP